MSKMPRAANTKLFKHVVQRLATLAGMLGRQHPTSAAWRHATKLAALDLIMRFM